MSKVYNLEALRPLSLFSPDVRLQQVTVGIEPQRIFPPGQGQRRAAEVLFVLRREPDEVLLINRAPYPAGTYRLPTGGVETAESPQEAATREIYEETGYQVTAPGLLGVVDYTLHLLTPRQGEVEWPDEGASFVSYVFMAEVDPAPEPKPARPGEIDGYRWVPVQALDDVARQLRTLPDDWASWGRFRATSYEFIRCGIMSILKTSRNQLGAGR